MKTKIILILLTLTSMLSGEVLFYDDFNRDNGPIGNGWTNVGPAVNSSIEDGVMQVEAGFNRGISRTFEAINSGIYYLQYDWKFSASDWFVSSFPSDIPVYLLWENTGSLYLDATGFFNNSTLIGQYASDSWINIKWKINLDSNQYSLWIDNNLIVENQITNSISSFNGINFRTSNGSNGIQYVDDFFLYNNIPPQVPTGLLATSSVNNITLNWDQPTNSDFLNYQIFRGITSPASELIAELNCNVFEFIDDSLEANTDYFYRIKAISLNTLESDFSQEVTGHLQAQPLLSLDSDVINFGLANPSQDITFTLANIGAYQLDYNLSGTDDLSPDNQLIDIPGFLPMGTYQGHTYYVSNNRMTWQNAKTLCQDKGGHLVTISDAAENNFVYQNTTDKSWIGFTDQEEEGNWQWVTGEDVTYTNWLPTEPNNSGNNEHYAHIRHREPFDQWNDNPNTSSNNPYAVLEFDFLFPPSILIFDNNSGSIETGSSQDFTISIDASNLADGVYDTSIKLLVEGISQAFYYPLTLNVDFNPPSPVEGLLVDSNTTDANQIGIAWTSNSSEDQVQFYHIFRKGRDEADWSLMGEVASTQNSFIDNDFTPLDTTYVYYSLQAEDWVGNLSLLSQPLIASLERYLAPENLQIANLNDRDIQLTWTPVNQTITGIPGTPSCYIIYKSQNPSPLSDFDFLAVSFLPEYLHNWALYFQPADRLYYIVTAYGGNMARLNNIIAQKQTWTKEELEKELRK